MIAFHDPDGTVTITFNSQCETLAAPGPKGSKYIPCDRCGKLEVVAKNVVATFCELCYENVMREDLEIKIGN